MRKQKNIGTFNYLVLKKNVHAGRNPMCQQRASDVDRVLNTCKKRNYCY